MLENSLLSEIPDVFKYKIAKCVRNATGDDIKEDIRHNRLDEYNNGDSRRVWDFINRNLLECFMDDFDTVVTKTKRGSWVMVPVFEKQTGTLITLMREARFKDLKNSCLIDGGNSHYLTALISSLNENILPEIGEQVLFDFDKNEKEQNVKRKITEKILEDLQIPTQVVNRYAIVLFESKNYELLSLRCCVMDSNLDIIAQDDWSKYIVVSESAVVEQISAEDEINNCPSRGISFKDKAILKKKQKREYVLKRQEKEIKNI